MTTYKYAIAFRDKRGNTMHGIYAQTLPEIDQLNEVVAKLREQYPAKNYQIQQVH